MSSPAWVIDTNVLISAVLTSGGNCDQILRAAMDGKIRLAWSSPMLAEYRAVLSRPKFKLPPEVVTAMLKLFASSDQVTPTQAPSLPDIDDEVFLATALATPDKILITGNTAHFPSEVCAPVQILNPAQGTKLLSSKEYR